MLGRYEQINFPEKFQRRLKKKTTTEFIDIHCTVSDIKHTNGRTDVNNVHITRSILLILRKERKGRRGCLKSSMVTLHSAMAIFRARRLSYDP
jgi:hypothetical protein